MKINRNVSSRTIGRVCTALLALSTLSAYGQQTEQSPSGQIINFSAKEGLRAEDAAQILARRLQLNASTDELRSVYIERPGDGLQVQRFNQYYKGLRVEHGTYTLTSKNGTPTYAFGKFYPTAAIAGTAPILDEATALSKALAFIPAEKYAWQTGAEDYPVGKLTFVEDFNGDQPDGILHLAYAFDIYAIAPERREMVYVDATTGKILLSDAILKHAHVPATGATLYSDTVSFMAEKIGSLYYLHDSTRGKGIYTYDLNNSSSIPPNSSPMLATSPLQVTDTSSLFRKDAAIDAHWGATIVYDYWMGAHNRNSWDGNGGALRSYVHYGVNYNNASWSGSRMQYGDGSGLAGGGFPPLTALDVCAHEIGHGICQATASLVYQRESGAMNEGFSDIWGAVIEAHGDPHENDAIAKNPWLIAEELTNTMRSMENPKLYQQPDTYLGTYWMDASSRCSPGQTNDNCGVHYNSGVLNHWFYILTEGAKGTNDLDNAYNVTGIGMAKAAKVAYLTELALNSTANYAACRTASIAAANSLYGPCSPEVEAVTRAWYAVGVGANFVPCVPQVSFNVPVGTIIEDAANNSCHPSRAVSIPFTLKGGALSGDSAVASIVVVGGTAIAGVDYDLVTPTVTFKVGGVTTQPIVLNVYDNGTSNANKYVDLTYVLAAGGSNATASVFQDTARIYIANDDFAPYAEADELRKVLTYNTVANTTSPFLGNVLGAKFQYLYRASELAAAGIRPGVPLTGAEFFVMSKTSTAPFRNYTMKLAPTSRTELSSGYINSGFTTVFSADVTTGAASVVLPFTTPFVWNGTDNLAVEICYENDAVGFGNDAIQAQVGGYFMAAMISSNGTGGCTLGQTTAPINNRPVIWFKQPTQVETVVNGTRTWDVDNGQDIYFYSHNAKKLIAAVLQPSDSLGCVTTTVTVAGNGAWTSANGLKRSVKEFSIQPGRQLGTVSYDGIIYFRNEELAGISRGRVKIVQTTSADDNSITSGNTNIVTPSEVIYGLDYTGFRGRFNGFGRFFLEVGGALSVGTSAAQASEMWTGENPFRSSPVLHWNLAKQERVNIRLYDIAGKLVYSNEQTLAAGNHQTTLTVGSDLAPGTYVLQVVRPAAVFTRQLVKQ